MAVNSAKQIANELNNKLRWIGLSVMDRVKLVNHLIFWKFMEEKGFLDYNDEYVCYECVDEECKEGDECCEDNKQKDKKRKKKEIKWFWKCKWWENKNYEQINEIWEKLPKFLSKKKEDIKPKFEEIIKNYNFPKELDKIKDTLFSEINNKITDVQWDFFGKMYEEFLSTIADAGNLWEFYTPRHIVEFMTFILESLGLDADKTVCDPSCGSGWFLVKLFEDVYKDKNKDENIHWWEINQDSYIFALMNMFVHWDGKAQLENVDSLDENHYTKFFDTFDYIIANPPYGAKW